MSQEQKDTAWKANLYLRGSLAGLLIGFLAAHFYARASEETNDGPQEVKATDTIKVLVAVLSLMRQITELGSGKNK
jgi:hypothetical protein